MNDIIQQKLDSYELANANEEEQALKEIIQEIALYALWRCDFFEVAAFQGGTSLRILHGLPRFSEDLDFILKEEVDDFKWDKYLGSLLAVFEEYGVKSEAVPKGKLDKIVKTAVIKDNSIVNQLNLSFYKGHRDKKLRVKLEIDVNPPPGSGYDYTYLDFPTDYEVCQQDLPSNFALKIHALLCRGFLKGRDWYDFNWYIKQGVSPNLALLKNALVQSGPWEGQEELEVDIDWLKDTLQEKIDSIDWNEAANDVEPFMKVSEQPSLKLWNTRFFGQKLKNGVKKTVFRMRNSIGSKGYLSNDVVQEEIAFLKNIDVAYSLKTYPILENSGQFSSVSAGINSPTNLAEALLWKLGKWGSYKEYVAAYRNDDSSPKNNVVFWAFARHLKDNKNPIFDQHALRAFWAINPKLKNTAQREIKSALFKKNTGGWKDSGSGKDYILCYRNFIEFMTISTAAEDAPSLLDIDRLLMPLGKAIKKNFLAFCEFEELLKETK